MRVFKPITPSRRFMTVTDYRVLTKKEPEKRLLTSFKKRAGRSKTQGKITVRHRGGGSKRMYRIVDFRQDKFDIEGNVVSIEYDPYRTAFIALIRYRDGEKRYVLAPEGLHAGDRVVTSEKADFRPGNRMKLKYIPTGTFIHNVELFPGAGGRAVKSAGSAARILAKEEDKVHVELPSTEIRAISGEAFASIGRLSHTEHHMVVDGKAGRTRWKGRRPHVRGSAMNPVDHPHGGGEGRAPIGLKYPKTPWGKPALGVKTRRRHKYSNVFIIQKRKKKRRK